VAATSSVDSLPVCAVLHCIPARGWSTLPFVSEYIGGDQQWPPVGPPQTVPAFQPTADVVQGGQAFPPAPNYPGGPYPQGYWYPPPPQPPRRRTGLVIAVVGAAVALALVVAVGLIWVGGRVIARKPLTGATTAPTSQTGGRTHPGALTGYLLTPPANSRPWKTKPTNDVYDLDQTAALSTNPTARAGVLRRFGFQQTAVVRWISSVNSIVEIRLYRFDSVDDATNFYREDTTLTTTSSWGQPTAVSGTPDAWWYLNPTTDSNGYVSTLTMAASGDIVIAMFVEQYAPAEPKETTQILSDQYAKL
jgi:hypothetical protein